MKLDKVANSGNDEFYTPPYAVEPLVKYIAPENTIWCPFDTDRSWIVKIFKGNGNKVVHTHIENGEDFFKLDISCNFIISNPPYSKKTEVFERLFSLGKPFAMLVGVVGLFESKRRFNLFRDYNFEIMWLSSRVSYLRSYDDTIPALNPPFSSVWLTRNILPNGNIFEQITKGNVYND